MPLYVKKEDWSKCQGIPTRVNDDVATEVLEYLFNTRNWKTNPEALILKVRRWRERLFTTEQRVVDIAPPVAAMVADDEPEETPDAGAPDDEPEHWTDRAVRLRSEHWSWSKIAADVGKPIGTVRDAVKRAGVAA